MHERQISLLFDGKRASKERDLTSKTSNEIPCPQSTKYFYYLHFEGKYLLDR
jgi:hypothetical protein